MIPSRLLLSLETANPTEPRLQARYSTSLLETIAFLELLFLDCLPDCFRSAERLGEAKPSVSNNNVINCTTPEPT